MNFKYPKAILIAMLTFITTISVAQNSRSSGRDLNIVFIGNSITYGGGLKDPGKEAPPVRAVEWLRNQRRAGLVNFRNMGFSGHTTVDFLPGGLQDFKKVGEAAASFSNKDAQLVFSLILGTNDSAVKGPKGAPVSPQNYEANLHAIADGLLSDFPGCKLIFQQPIWYSPNTHNRATYGAEGLARLQSYFPLIRKVVKSYDSTYPGQVFMGDRKAFKFFRKHAEDLFQHEQGVDGVFLLHPNKQGAVKLGEYWAKAIYNKLVD